ncbi:aconitase X swivel domain-containing protein [Sphingopyxis sp. R3-92]|uniref:aconitase X swivel domain-containing protein n=1 Tax=Sphingopyxis sp. R3-92 TaxID=3158553 RepID=UPI003EE5F3EF
MLIHGHALIAGLASGDVLKLTEPLSLWGGVDLQTGGIVDASHPQRGAVLANRLLAMPGSRGSSSSSSALVELARTGRAPAGVITTRGDPILTIGALVADYLYGAAIPILIVSDEDFGKLRCGATGHLWCEASQAVLTFPEDEPGRFANSPT